MKRWIYIAGAGAIAIALATSGNSDRKGPRAPDPEEALFSDLDRAGPELDQRLAQSLRVQHGLLYIKDPLFGDLDLAVMPTPASWVLHCGIGITVTFGRSYEARARSDDIDSGATVASPDAEITLSTALLDQKTCAAITPLIGNKLLAILRAG